MKRVQIAAALALVACVAASAGPASAQVTTPLNGPNGTSFRKVLVIGTDGTRWDLVQRAIKEGKAPNLKRLIAQGLGGPTLLPYAPPQALTLSEVGWSTIATGVGPAKHGVNGFKVNKDPKQATKNGFLDFLSQAGKDRPALSTFLSSDWANIGLHMNGGPIFGDGIDTRFSLAALDTVPSYNEGDAAVTAEAARYLKDRNPDAGFVYLGLVDEMAHAVGSATADYRNSIALTDSRIGLLLKAIRARPTYGLERWTVIVTTDHGQQNFNFGSLVSHGGGTQLERTSFVVARGPGIPAGVGTRTRGVEDINPTVLHQLGLTAPGSLDGHSFVGGRAAAPRPAARVTVRVPRRGKPTLSLVGQAAKGAPRIRALRIKLPRGMRLLHGSHKRPTARGRADGRRLSSRRVRTTRRTLTVRLAGNGSTRIVVKTGRGRLRVSRRLRRRKTIALTGRVAEVGGSALVRPVTARVRR